MTAESKKLFHYYIVFSDSQLEAHEFHLEELLGFCRRRGWKKPFTIRLEVFPEKDATVSSDFWIEEIDRCG